MKPRFLKFLVAASLLAGSAASQAGVLFSDNFDASAGGLNVTPTGWTVSDGTVDVVSGGFCLAGRCIDLDGSSGNAGVLSRTFALLGGVEYVLSFDLAGNRRSGIDDVLVSFGSASRFFDDLASNSPYTGYTLNFTPDSDGMYSISFANAGGDNVGALLENVVITALDGNQGEVPEPASVALAGLGLAALYLTRRKRAKPNS
ncbi:PEP-CTERM sorting domain-containing protein [Massilia sp. MS-15]|uniref:PEP-CTERM sorting domain-containing protein n=1 Tax=Massilia sp. MS-15 TaxID=2878200 RepID=UPI001CD69AAC|nr:PEP-CTERM sorting domain-containing protein [Massilia sp. MS-15]MCA1246590.1 PEP-CTERM sorting domain-containing protein [Massilia sp. MS-15]